MNDLMFPHTLRSVLLIVMTLTLAGPAHAQAVEHKLTASNDAPWGGENFGGSVSLSGERALVGAVFGANNQDIATGAAYLYEPRTDGSWAEMCILTASDGEWGHLFGHSVSLSEGRALVGAPGDGGGSVYIFERQEDGSWTELDKLTTSDGGGLGVSVSLSGNRVLAGAYADNDLGPYSGAAYIFERQNDGSWIEMTKLIASDGTEDEYFGFSVSLSGDYALVGAHRDKELGFYAGAAYVFERQNDGSWMEVTKLTASDGTKRQIFGESVSLLGDRALVGAWGDDDMGDVSGAAYIFERQNDGSWSEVHKLTASDGDDWSLFGKSVSLSEGTRALVGASWDDSNGSGGGAVYLFERQTDGSWAEIEKLTSSDGNGGDNFGASVSASEDRILIGAAADEGNGPYSGSAYVYENLVTAVEVPTDLPANYLLSAPYPNPFNPQVQFSLEVAQSQQVRIEVINTLGRRVDVLQDGPLPGRGIHRFTFDAGSLPSGVYLLRVTGESFTATRTITLLK